MLGENKKIIERSNVLDWHKNGITGENVTIVCMDDDSAVMNYMKDYCEAPLADRDYKFGHGTKVAQVVHEFLPNAKIVLLPQTRKSDEVKQWVLDHSNEIDIINISLTASNKRVAERYFGYLKDLDIPIVCGAGNDYDDEDRYPAKFEWTVSVGAYLNRRNNIASYSNEGVDVSGFTNIYVRNNIGKVIDFNGTSASSPYITALLGAYGEFRKINNLPKLTINEGKQFAIENTIDIEDEGFDEESGYGLVVLPKYDELKKKIKKQYKQINYNNDNKERIDNMKHFKDVSKNRWSYKYIQEVAEKEILNGYKDGTFRPERPITREEMAVIISRILNYK